MKVQRCTEIGDAPSWQGEKSENTGNIRPMNNTAMGMQLDYWRGLLGESTSEKDEL